MNTFIIAVAPLKIRLGKGPSPPLCLRDGELHCFAISSPCVPSRARIFASLAFIPRTYQSDSFSNLNRGAAIMTTNENIYILHRRCFSSNLLAKLRDTELIASGARG